MVFLCDVVSEVHLSRIANSADSDQTAPKEQSDLCLPCLLKSARPNFWGRYGMCMV